MEFLDLVTDSHPMTPFWSRVFELSPVKEGVAYVTVDNATLKVGQVQRSAGPHVDGNYYGTEAQGGWAGDPQPGWLRPAPVADCQNAYVSTTGGALIYATEYGTRVWKGHYFGRPRETDGDCRHLRKELELMHCFVTVPGVLYWINSMCIHESIPAPFDCTRLFVRITLAPDAPWMGEEE